MSLITRLLKSRQSFPKPVADWNFGHADKIIEGATSTDVAGWTGETIATGTATLDLAQATAAAQPVFVQEYDTTGSELVTNGTFDGNDLTGWSSSLAASATITGVNNELVMAANDPDSLGAYYEVNFEAEKTYTVKLDVVSSELTGGSDGIGQVRVGTSNSVNSSGAHTEIAGSGEVSNGSNIFIYTALTDATYIYIGGRDDVDELIVDNISVFEAVENNSKSHLLFDGDDYLEGMPTQSGDFTYIIKFSTDSIATDGVLLGSSSTSNPLLLIDSPSGQIFYRSSLGILRTMSTSSYDDDVPHILALTRSGTTVTCVIDDVETGSEIDAGDFLVDWLGDRGTSSPFTGKIFKTLIYAETLTDDEITAKTASLA